jgi:nitrite reductase (NADH) large subunit
MTRHAMQAHSHPPYVPAAPVSETVLHQPIVIIGSGPVGVRAAQLLLEHDPHCEIVLYGNEPWEPYNRVRLSAFLQGELKWNDLLAGQQLPNTPNLLRHYNCRITRIDPQAHTVTDEFGRTQSYRKLILATGSRPHVPAVPGVQLPGVFCFRNLSDIEKLLARRIGSRHTVVLGGGVLGIEAAHAMSRQHNAVTIIDHAPTLMNKNLDAPASEILRQHLEALNIRCMLGMGIKLILGERKVEQLLLLNHGVFDCDTLILATGIRPNLELAMEARISVNRGIRVDDNMQTSQVDVYAIGECAEHRGEIYGLLAPGYEQAAVAVHHLHGRVAAYRGSVNATKLKVVGKAVFSMGAVSGSEEDLEVSTLEFRGTDDIYRKLFIRRGQLVGAIATGNWSSTGRLQEALLKHRLIWPWQRWRFKRQGELWPATTQAVQGWPAATLVCQCMQINRGQCSEAIAHGATTLTALSQRTHAGTVCGSCKPLLANLLGANSQLDRDDFSKSNTLAAGVALLGVVVLSLFGPIAYTASVDQLLHWDQLWRSGVLKQVSGYLTLGLTVCALLISLRKRLPRIQVWRFSTWRLGHVVLGSATVVSIAAHTGWRGGHQLNAYLMLTFITLLLLGSLAGLTLAQQHRLRAATAARLRTGLVWLHILVFWPLPALLLLHILKIYYF